MKRAKAGKWRADKVEYPDGIGCCLWYVIDGDEEAGICMDFAYEDVNVMIDVLNQLKSMEAEKYEETDEKD